MLRPVKVQILPHNKVLFNEGDAPRTLTVSAGSSSWLCTGGESSHNQFSQNVLGASMTAVGGVRIRFCTMLCSGLCYIILSGEVTIWKAERKDDKSPRRAIFSVEVLPVLAW